MVKPLTVYKASAGSGKTFALAVQFIKLVVRDPQAYRHILAVTFTNKATEEMKTRILSQLYGIWKMKERPDDFPESKTYMSEVCKALGAEPAFVSERAGIALSLLLHNYNHFRVMTIDTFFQSVLRNLARELDLAANLRLSLNDTQIEELAVDELINDLQTTDTLLQWILNYIMENISEDRSWNVIHQIKQFGKNIFRDYYKDISQQLEACLQQENFFDTYTRTLRSLRQNAKKQMQDTGEAFFDILDSEGLTVDDLAGKQRGIASFFNKLRNGVFDEGIVNQTVEKCLENPDKWYTKSHPRRELIHALAAGVLGRMLRDAVKERPRQWLLYQSATLTLRHLNQVRLLSSIEKKVRSMNEEGNRFLLSDTQKLLNTLISDSDSPFIFEKIGTQLEHIMIDEFQDTSTVQWKNFRVLLAETMSHEGSENLIVGDVKQSIYRWRSGDWRLLNDIEQQFTAEMIQTESLKTNRRSERNVIEFNNAFFTEAIRQEHLQLADYPEAPQLLRAYEDVEQVVPEGKPKSGYVSICLLPTKDYLEETLKRLVAIVTDLTDRHIAPDKMAILVRANSHIPVIANYFAEYCPQVSIVSDEAFRLDASPSVNIIVQALRLLTHPDDQLTRAYLERACRRPFPTDSATTDRYLQMPLYELVEQLFADLQLDRFTDQSAYVCAFFDQLMAYTCDHAATINDFLTEWEENIRQKTIQSDVTDGIRIISIHKSKGLEFDHVLLPFCDWQLEKAGNVLWCHPAEEPFSRLPIAPIDYSQKGMTGTIYEQDYKREHLQNVVDNMNLLYVAFTRARSSLFVIGRRAASRSRSDIIEKVLPALQGRLDMPEDADAPVTFDTGSISTPASETVGEKHTTCNVFLKTETPIALDIQRQAVRAEFRQSNQSRDFIHGDDDQAAATSYIQLGNILHRVFSTIRTHHDVDNALRQLEAEGIIYDDQLTTERIRGLLRERLTHPRVADWFSERWTLFNECTILSMENGRLTERRPDRVLTDGNEMTVVDFKFGKPHNEYHSQVREYMQLLRAMGYQHVRGFLWYVYSNKIEEVD